MPNNEYIVNHPSHYTQGKALGIETIDVIRNELTDVEYAGYLKGQVIKYVSRMGKKGTPSADAGKAAWYAERLKELMNQTNA